MVEPNRHLTPARKPLQPDEARLAARAMSFRGAVFQARALRQGRKAGCCGLGGMVRGDRGCARAILPIVLATGMAAPAPAQDLASRATPDADSTSLSAICTDRPTKANYACTVDAAHFQYEADVLNASASRLNGVVTDTLLVSNPTLKYGLASGVDLEANISPLEIVRTHDQAKGVDRTLAGPSDLYLRLKYEVLDLPDDVLEASVIPYVKAPTARPGLGNGSVEGGALLPINYKINSVFTLTTAPEVDAYKDASGEGRHLNTVQLINLAATLPKGFTLYGELWGDWNFDPAATVKQYSFDTAVTYGVTKYLQLDIGANLGLNRQTPGVQAYVGVSQKF